MIVTGTAAAADRHHCRNFRRPVSGGAGSGSASGSGSGPGAVSSAAAGRHGCHSCKRWHGCESLQVRNLWFACVCDSSMIIICHIGIELWRDAETHRAADVMRARHEVLDAALQPAAASVAAERSEHGYRPSGSTAQTSSRALSTFRERRWSAWPFACGRRAELPTLFQRAALYGALLRHWAASAVLRSACESVQRAAAASAHSVPDALFVWLLLCLATAAVRFSRLCSARAFPNTSRAAGAAAVATALVLVASVERCCAARRLHKLPAANSDSRCDGHVDKQRS